MFACRSHKKGNQQPAIARELLICEFHCFFYLFEVLEFFKILLYLNHRILMFLPSEVGTRCSCEYAETDKEQSEWRSSVFIENGGTDAKDAQGWSPDCSSSYIWGWQLM